MATELQKATVDTLEQNIKKMGKVSVSRAMREAVTIDGKKYAPSVAKNPKILTSSKGFQEIYAKKGLSVGLIAGSLKDDIEKKPQNRVAELRLGAEILKMTDKENGEGNKTLIINITGETAQRYNLIPTPSPKGNSTG